LTEPALFVERLAEAEIGETFNFYREGSGAAERRRRLTFYLSRHRDARLVLVGEAAGYRGARVSGVAFTSERQLTGGDPAEASATIVHRALEELGLAEQVLLWNVVPTHPHRPGEHASNRRPSRTEIEAAGALLREVCLGRRTIAVGRVAHAVLGGRYVRHPSHGGAAAFREGLLQLALGGQNVRRFL
jgi:hypothetical protein